MLCASPGVAFFWFWSMIRALRLWQVFTSAKTLNFFFILLEGDLLNILCHKSHLGSLMLGFRSLNSHFVLLILWRRMFLLVLLVPDPLLSSYHFTLLILHKFLLPVCRRHRFWDQNHTVWSVTVCTTMSWGPLFFLSFFVLIKAFASILEGFFFWVIYVFIVWV